MDYALMANFASLGTGTLSAAFWVVSAVVKVEPPEELRGKPDDMYYGYIIANGSDLIPTIKAQAKWNSAAAITAAVTVLLQVVANLIS